MNHELDAFKYLCDEHNNVKGNQYELLRRIEALERHVGLKPEWPFIQTLYPKVHEKKEEECKT